MLTLFAKSLENVEGSSKWQDQIKRNVFSDSGSRKLFLSEDGHKFRDSEFMLVLQGRALKLTYSAGLNTLIRYLTFGKSTDEEIAQGFVEDCVELLDNDKKGKKIDQVRCACWMSFAVC